MELKQDNRKNNGGHSKSGRISKALIYGEEVVKKEMRIPISAMENIDLVLLCHEIKNQVTGINKICVELAMKNKKFVDIIQAMQENTPKELRKSTVNKLKNIVL